MNRMSRAMTPRWLHPVATSLSLALALSACSSVEQALGDKVDYKANAQKTANLEVPPDLTPLQRDGRYKPQRGQAVTASGMATLQQEQAKEEANPLVAPNQVGNIRVERQGQERWLVVPLPPEQVWQQVKDFWTDAGFNLTVENPVAGVMETDWKENRARLPDDIIRRTLGKVLDSIFDSGFRDRFRTRIERVGENTEIYVSHKAIEEMARGGPADGFKWETRPADPQLEAEILTRIMVRLGSREEQAKKAVESAKPAAAASAASSAAVKSPTSAERPLAPGVSVKGDVLTVQDNFERSWRRVGLALDRTGFTVEDRDRSLGLYFLRWLDPRGAGKEEPNWLVKLFKGDDLTRFPKQLRLKLSTVGDSTQVRVLLNDGQAAPADLAGKFLTQLAPELR